ncbi:MAG: phosphatidylserine decarboxylase family protein [Sedimentisphaerales bacterium]|nr:phosphatidylserine decarboxylase family protein [Sedimentisphaerales bacterium]
MNFKLTKYGQPQIIVLQVALIVLMLICLFVGMNFLSLLAVLFIETVIALILISAILFFRDPERIVPVEANLLLAPADGKIIDIETIQESSFINGRAIRIGIFMSIFDVHINRSPCNANIHRITYVKGKHKNAANPDSGRVNESNELAMVRTDSPGDKLIVRQISGAIARRIVCEAKKGQTLTSGQKFGMVKFGSRAELYVPVSDKSQCLVKVGDKVKAGVTALVKYENS